MYIDKVIMVLNREAAPGKNGVVMVRIVNNNSFFGCQQSIRIFILPKLPDIYISGWSMLWLGPIQAARISFYYHHFETVTIIEGCHFGNSTAIKLIALFIPLEYFSYPLRKFRLFRQNHMRISLFQFFNAIKNNSTKPLRVSKGSYSFPVYSLWYVRRFIFPYTEPYQSKKNSLHIKPNP